MYFPNFMGRPDGSCCGGTPISCAEIDGYISEQATSLVDLEWDYSDTDDACCENIEQSHAGESMLWDTHTTIGRDVSAPWLGGYTYLPSVQQFCGDLPGTAFDPYDMDVTVEALCYTNGDVQGMTINVTAAFYGVPGIGIASIQWFDSIDNFEFGREYEIPLFSFDGYSEAGFECGHDAVISPARLTIHRPE